MLSLRNAAALLAGCDSSAAARPLLAQLGFTTELPVSEALRASLELDARHLGAQLHVGPGALRAFVVELAAGAAFAELTAALTRRLASRAPHVLWIVATMQREPAMLAISTPRGAPTHGAATMLVERSHVYDGDAETLASLAAVPWAGAPDLTVHSRWVELLGREALNRRFYRALERGVHELAAEARGGRSADERAEVALQCSSRLLFLAFLQGKGWLDGDRGFLARVFDACMAQGGSFHRRTLRPLFFGTLNTTWPRRAPAARAFGAIPFLNGGLFAPTRAERGSRAPVLTDAALGAFLHDVLGRYRFTAREDRSTHAEAAVDPEMLGRAFESLMASRERRDSGTFFTPSAFAGRVVDGALVAALERLVPAAMRPAIAALVTDARASSARDELLLTALDRLTVLDPACGSGALLVHALDQLTAWVRRAGDHRPTDAIRRDLVARNLFGVDRNPTAVWLCELRLWLAIVVDCDEADPRRVIPLPNLDRNIRVGDALMAPLAIDQSASARSIVHRDADATRVGELRARYARATGRRKQAVAIALDRAERSAAITQVNRELARIHDRRRDIIAVRRSRDLFGDRTTSLSSEAADLRTRAAALRRERRRLSDGGGIAFRYDAHFADVMADHGFCAVVGNPPWVRLHRIPPVERHSLRERYDVLRHAAWDAGAAAGGAGAGFAGQADLAALFVERSLHLLRPHGVLSLLVPAKLWTALAGGGVRRLLHTRARVLALEDCSGAPDMFDAVTYPSIVVAVRMPSPGVRVRDCASFATHRGTSVARWRDASRSVALDDTPGSPWLLLPPAVRRAFEHLRRRGAPLADGPTGRPVLGLKSGCNDAFLVHLDGIARSSGQVAISDRRGRRGMMDATLLRPVIRGEQVRTWRRVETAERIIWTHDAVGVLRSLPTCAAEWLAPHRQRLSARTDTSGGRPWWSLHRTEGAQNRSARVVWADLTRVPRACWLEPGDPAVPLNTCYVLRCPHVEDAQAIAALLNSPLAAAWLRSLAEPARGRYCRLLAWTTALLPLPADWERARTVLAPLGVRGAQGEPPGVAELLDAALAAYRVRHLDVAPLLEWHAPDVR